ncbi:MAG: hypothetical protein LBU94_01680 [Clostridiales bacterium]|jgi:hypothetical protein|nr:hypothetical protein [Clostridiales bacterium]
MRNYKNLKARVDSSERKFLNGFDIFQKAIDSVGLNGIIQKSQVRRVIIREDGEEFSIQNGACLRNIGVFEIHLDFDKDVFFTTLL